MASGNWFQRKKTRSRRVSRPPQRAAPHPAQSRLPAEVERASIFERPTVVPATTPQEQAERANRAQKGRPAAGRRAAKASQRPTRPSPSSQDPSQTGASAATVPATQRSAQLQPQHVLGVLRPRSTADGTPNKPRAEGVASAEDGARGVAPRSSLTLPGVDSQGSVAGALRFVDAQSRRSAPPPTFETATLGEVTRSPAIDLHPSLSDLYALDDFSGALEVAERRLTEDPADAYAQRVASDCRQVLAQMYLARIGRLEQRPRVVVDDEQLRWLSLDHHSGFLLSLIDGQFTLEELLDICGMSRVEALKLLAELTEKGVVAIE